MAEGKFRQPKKGLAGEVGLLGTVCHELVPSMYNGTSHYLRRLILKEALLGQSTRKRVPNLSEIGQFSHSN